MIEIWNTIENHPNYLISNFGNVMNRKKGTLLKPYLSGSNNKKNKKGQYLKVVLNGVQYYVHRLVASKFCSNPKKLNCVDHISGDKLNNHFTNLRYVTHRENIIAYHQLKKLNTL